jgi:prepilin-type N-terminal cleavage/methylation domain-containing protein
MRKGFSLVELIAGLALLAVVAGLAATGGSQVVQRSKQRAAVFTLTSTQADSLRLAARRDLKPGDTNLQQFPADLVSRLAVNGLEFTSGTSDREDLVSVSVTSSTRALLAVQAGGRCLLMAEDLEGTPRWAQTGEICEAVRYEATTVSWSEDPGSPTDLDQLDAGL